jgi:hypothetical protein
MLQKRARTLRPGPMKTPKTLLTNLMNTSLIVYETLQKRFKKNTDWLKRFTMTLSWYCKTYRVET